MERAIEQFIQSRCGVSATTRNRVELLNDGREMYASLVAALHRAHHTIDLEYYIFDDDRIGRAIAEVLMRKARSGLRVRLIYDVLGSWMPAWGLIRRLKRAGVEVHYFRPIRWKSFFSEINIRNHRKIVIVDDRIAYVGGINIARRYLEGNELGKWRDEHIRLEGESVTSLIDLFEKDWIAVGGAPREQSIVLPVAIKGNQQVQIAWSEEGPTRSVIEQVWLSLILHARREVLLSTPYFVPTPALLDALCRVARRGVRVVLMAPAKAGSALLTWAALAPMAQLMEAGAEILLYEKGFLHTKMMVIDRLVTYIGTANLDYRSLRLNWEVAAFITDRSFGRYAAATFRRDRAHCHIPTKDEIVRRANKKRGRTWVARLFRRWL